MAGKVYNLFGQNVTQPTKEEQAQVKEQIQAAVVKTLEEILERTKAGEIESFILAAAEKNGGITTAWGNTPFLEKLDLINYLQADALLELLKFQYTE